MKLRYLVAALGLVASASSHATLIVPDAYGNGEMALVVWDANASYTLDTGLTYSSFLASSGVTNANLATLSSANWSAFATAEAANVSTWQYAFIGGKLNNAGINSAIMSTISADYVGQVADYFYSSDVESATAQISPYYTALNYTGTHWTSPNGDSYNLKGTPAYFNTSNMETFNGTFYENSSNVGTAMAVDNVRRNQAPTSLPTETTLGTMNLVQSANGNYVLSYTVAAVPEAPGIVLAATGFGLMGLVARRRRHRG